MAHATYRIGNVSTDDLTAANVLDFTWLIRNALAEFGDGQIHVSAKLQSLIDKIGENALETAVYWISSASALDYLSQVTPDSPDYLSYYDPTPSFLENITYVVDNCTPDKYLEEFIDANCYDYVEDNGYPGPRCREEVDAFLTELFERTFPEMLEDLVNGRI